jgi:hypothetical protein
VKGGRLSTLDGGWWKEGGVGGYKEIIKERNSTQVRWVYNKVVVSSGASPSSRTATTREKFDVNQTRAGKWS